MALDRRTIPLTTLLILLAASLAQAATIAVPGQQPTLAAALAAARAGDVIELAPGRYAESGLEIERAVTIRGLGANAGEVVIDGGGVGRLLFCEDVAGTIVLQDLTLRGGHASGSTSRLRSGGAVYVARSELVAQNCRFEDNSATAHGGAIRFVAAGGRLSQCVFSNNLALLGGGAVDCSYEAAPVIERCMFQGNVGGWGGGLSCRGWSSPVVDRNIFTGNSTGNLYGFGGGVFADLESSPRITRCTLNGNEAAYGGALGCFQGSLVTVDECTIVGNIAAGAGGGIYCIDGSPQVTSSIVAFQQGTGVTSVGLSLPALGCSDIFGNTFGDVAGPVTGVAGTDPVVSIDPAFCSTSSDVTGMFPLRETSPLAGASCGGIGAWPAACTVGLPAVVNFLADAASGRTTVRWWTSGDHAGARYRMTWAVADGAEHGMVVTQVADDAFQAVSDEPPADDGSVRFRLYVAGPDEVWSMLTDSGYATGNDGEPEVPAPIDHLAVRNYPNPFNPETTIAVTVKRSGRVRVGVYGLDGRRVRLLADRVFGTGEEDVRWDGRDDAGRAMSSGTYLVRVESESESRSLKVTLLK